jgi:hypothetical protein
MGTIRVSNAAEAKLRAMAEPAKEPLSIIVDRLLFTGRHPPTPPLATQVKPKVKPRATTQKTPHGFCMRCGKQFRNYGAARLHARMAHGDPDLASREKAKQATLIEEPYIVAERID